jgi:hypothetical protein
MREEKKGKKDWVGNNKALYTTLGASSHALEDRQEIDYYATSPVAINHLLRFHQPTKVWEPSAGELHLVDAMREVGIDVYATDIIERGRKLDKVMDFMLADKWDGDIVMNPPYKFALQHINKALSIIGDGQKVFAFLKIQFLEGKARKKFFELYPPKEVLIFSFRVPCFKNGRFDLYDSSAIAYAWFVWEKGFCGDPIIKWI